MKFSREFVRDGEPVAVHVERLEGKRFRVRVGDNEYEYSADLLADGGLLLQHLCAEGESPSRVAYGVGSQQSYTVRVDGKTHALSIPTTRRGGARGGADGAVRAPMTGTVLDVLCAPGDEVEADQTLVVVSAMKMEHKLTAGVSGTVLSVSIAKDANVDQGDELVVVKATKG